MEIIKLYTQKQKILFPLTYRLFELFNNLKFTCSIIVKNIIKLLLKYPKTSMITPGALTLLVIIIEEIYGISILLKMYLILLLFFLLILGIDTIGMLLVYLQLQMIKFPKSKISQIYFWLTKEEYKTVIHKLKQIDVEIANFLNHLTIERVLEDIQMYKKYLPLLGNKQI
ncbi:MAG: hypothetical protein HC932_03810 [Thermales bacterium]|nr:hypothetical protein [Thermales bacterium]